MLKVSWNEQICIHNGNCVKSLPQVFKIENGQFVIQPANAPAEEVQCIVAACPSGALRIES